MTDRQRLSRQAQGDILVSVDGAPPIGWPAFCAANAEAFAPDELAAIGADLQRDGLYLAGGGAAPDVEIRLVAPSAEVA